MTDICRNVPILVNIGLKGPVLRVKTDMRYCVHLESSWLNIIQVSCFEKKL